MGFTRSPLRYPGGKTRLSPFIYSLLKTNDLDGSFYIETFAGGAGIAWSLLLDGYVNNIILNDLDTVIYSFWKSVINNTDDLCKKVKDTPINIKYWNIQREILNHPSHYNKLELGFAAFYLNRTNRSGIIRGGVIGGKDQDGEWKINARFNKARLIKRITKIAEYKNRIKLYNLDATKFITEVLPNIVGKGLIFIDPPYIHRGHDLYMNNYNVRGHSKLATVIKNNIKQPWVVSYDNVPEVNQFYTNYKRRYYHLNYSVNSRYKGSEAMIFSNNLTIPRNGLLILSTNK